MSEEKFKFGECGILWSADREKYHARGYRLYLSGPRMEVSLGPEFEKIQPYDCCLGLLISPNGDSEIVTVPTAPIVPFGFYDLVGDHWKTPVTSDYLFTRVDSASPPIRLHCWEGPADFLSSCEAC